MNRTDERWREVAALATQEQDPEKLLKLIRELNILLDTKRPSENDVSGAAHSDAPLKSRPR